MDQKRDGFGKPQHYYETVCRKGNPHNNREKTCHRDGRIPGRIDYPTTAAEILTYIHRSGGRTSSLAGSALSAS